MKIYSDNGSHMAAAVARVYGRRAMDIEGTMFSIADTTSPDYIGGSWAFVENDAGTLGFWYPTDEASYGVACQNYYDNPAMDARSFGAACTLCAVNSVIWQLHHSGKDIDSLATQYHALRNWIYDLGEGDEPFIDTATVAGFTD